MAELRQRRVSELLGQSLGDASGAAQSRAFLADARFELGFWEEGLEQWDRAVGDLRRTGPVDALRAALTAYGRGLAMTDADDRADPVLEEGLALVPDAGSAGARSAAPRVNPGRGRREGGDARSPTGLEVLDLDPPLVAAQTPAAEHERVIAPHHLSSLRPRTATLDRARILHGAASLGLHEAFIRASSSKRPASGHR